MDLAVIRIPSEPTGCKLQKKIQILWNTCSTAQNLTLPTRVNTVISISRPEVSFGEYLISGFLFVVLGRGVMHSLFLRGHELGGGFGRHVTQQPQQLYFIYFFLFIRNIPKRINYHEIS